MLHILPYHIDDAFFVGVGVFGIPLGLRITWWMLRDWMKGGR